MALTLILSLLISGGLAYGVATADKGDVLFPVKTEVRQEASALVDLSQDLKLKTQRAFDAGTSQDAEVNMSAELNADADADSNIETDEGFVSKNSNSINANAEVEARTHTFLGIEL